MFPIQRGRENYVFPRRKPGRPKADRSKPKTSKEQLASEASDYVLRY